MAATTLYLAAITLGAAIVNGALGYGFSSLTVPLALLFLTNRVLNPALVLIEVVLNAYVLFVNRRSIPIVWRRTVYLILGLGPGIVMGTMFVDRVSPTWLKLATFIVLLPLILLQAAGFRRPMRSERGAGLACGSGLGVLYSVTTISGPPLALLLSNQGLAKQEFRAALGLVRLAESSMTAIAYLWAGMFTVESIALIPSIVPSLIVGVLIGTLLIQHVRAETFRRLCMSFDAWVVAFGVSILLRQLLILPGFSSFVVLAGVCALDAWMLFKFFAVQRAASSVGERAVA